MPIFFGCIVPVSAPGNESDLCICAKNHTLFLLLSVCESASLLKLLKFLSWILNCSALGEEHSIFFSIINEKNSFIIAVVCLLGNHAFNNYGTLGPLYLE